MNETKPEYGSAGFKDHDYLCYEVYGSFKDCDLPAAHYGPHRMKPQVDPSPRAPCGTEEEGGK